MVRPRVLLLAAAAVGLAAVPGWAAPFSYVDFSSTAGLTLNGNTSKQGNELRLTENAPFRSGSAFTTSQVPLGNLNSFSTYFQFRIGPNGGIGDEDGQGADGIVFVIQTVNNNVGGAGGGLGYQGITPSLGIEFDTYNNGEISGNHVGVDLNGNVNSAVSVHEPTRFNNNQVWNAWIDYNGNTNQLEVRWSMSNVRPVASGLSYNVNLTSLLGQQTAYLGFTGGTGSGYGDQRILNWEYRDSFNPIAVPEPTSLILLALGGAGLLGYVRRKRQTVAVA